MDMAHKSPVWWGHSTASVQAYLKNLTTVIPDVCW